MNTAILEHSQFIVDNSGEKKSVILPIDIYMELLDEIEDLAIMAERRDEPVKKHEEFIEELKADGYL